MYPIQRFMFAETRKYSTPQDNFIPLALFPQLGDFNRRTRSPVKHVREETRVETHSYVHTLRVNGLGTTSLRLLVDVLTLFRPQKKKEFTEDCKSIHL